MIARKLEPQELYYSRRNMAVAFEGEFDFAAEREKAATQPPDPAEDHYGAFPDGASEPAASLVINKLPARFDGHDVMLGGVGGVATLPAFRRGGAIRVCVEASHRDLYRAGFAFAALYPFSTRYYSQFGYAAGAQARRWRVCLRDLAGLPDVGGRVRQLFPGDDLAPLTEIYNAVYGGVNLSVRRERYAPSLEKENFLSQKRSVFVWEDGAGRPRAFLVGSRQGEDLLCWPDFPRKSDGLLFADLQALTGLLRFVYTAFLANFTAIEFIAPSHIDLAAFLPELAGMNCQAVLNGMIRVIDVKQALSLCRCQGAGELALAVEDPLIPENNGTFRLAFGPGRENQVSRTEDAPDLALGAGALAQLLAGCQGAGDLPWMPGVRVIRPEAPLERVFYRKPCHILDLF